MHVAQRQVKKLQIAIRKNKDAVRQTQKHLDKIYLILVVKLEWSNHSSFLLNITNRMSFYHHQLKNGIRIVHKRTFRSSSLWHYYKRRSSRNESDEEQGLAHFIEHVILKEHPKEKPTTY